MTSRPPCSDCPRLTDPELLREQSKMVKMVYDRWIAILAMIMACSLHALLLWSDVVAKRDVTDWLTLQTYLYICTCAIISPQVFGNIVSLIRLNPRGSKT